MPAFRPREIHDAAQVAFPGRSASAATPTPALKNPQRMPGTPVLSPIGRYVRAEKMASSVGYWLAPQAGAVTARQIMLYGRRWRREAPLQRLIGDALARP